MMIAPGQTLRPASKVLPEQARRHNRSLVLQTLFHGGAMSRADVARHTGLTRVTVSDLVSELLAERLVAERGTREASGPGKPAIIVDIDRSAHRIVGLDLSGSGEFTGALMTLDGDVAERRVVPRPAADRDGHAVLDAVVALARALLDAAPVAVLGVGAGTPGVVDAEGTVVSAPAFAWSRLPLRRILSEALAAPVLVANDANAAVLAEYTFGAAGADTMLVKVGRGVGSGILTGGRLTVGSRHAAGEIGHVVVDDRGGGSDCVCGRRGCLEAWLSVPVLTDRLAAADDALARHRVLRDAGERLGIALAPVVGALDLSEIVLSGPAHLLDGTLRAATADTLRDRTLAESHEGLRVRMSAQGEDIVLRGAAVMVLHARLGVS